ncbi:hypothetical protein HLPCO_002363 [Haloplasma contractile SSD-17B]|uniref:Uncharacterized protein n=1 Tax=Haloplasma contractile SSD-17B TaxID=1033810 RepID=U2DT46_9MOLU|nr:hypothetical protein HLPCO_002363 [Haloplasma contractile SSD-17B]
MRSRPHHSRISNRNRLREKPSMKYRKHTNYYYNHYSKYRGSKLLKRRHLGVILILILFILLVMLIGTSLR